MAWLQLAASDTIQNINNISSLVHKEDTVRMSSISRSYTNCKFTSEWHWCASLFIHSQKTFATLWSTLSKILLSIYSASPQATLSTVSWYNIFIGHWTEEVWIVCQHLQKKSLLITYFHLWVIRNITFAHNSQIESPNRRKASFKVLPVLRSEAFSYLDYLVVGCKQTLSRNTKMAFYPRPNIYRQEKHR